MARLAYSYLVNGVFDLLMMVEMRIALAIHTSIAPDWVGHHPLVPCCRKEVGA